MLEEFKQFVLGGNMVDMAVGIVIGAAFGTIVGSLVEDILLPPIGLLLGGVDFSSIFTVLKDGATAAPYASLEAAKSAGAITINWGNFLNTIISFLIVAASIFAVIKLLNKIRSGQEEIPEPSVALLGEIRDLLKTQSAGTGFVQSDQPGINSRLDTDSDPASNPRY